MYSQYYRVFTVLEGLCSVLRPCSERSSCYLASSELKYPAAVDVATMATKHAAYAAPL